MARCCGETGCSCVVIAGDGVVITGDGTIATPYVVTADGGSGGGAGAVSTDGSFGLGVPLGVGLEFIITANLLDDITYDGNSL